MSKNIDDAVKAIYQMIADCQNKIDELSALKEVYQKLGNRKEFEDSDIAGIDLRNHINELQEQGYPLPMHGIFQLASQYRTINGVDGMIKQYNDEINYWNKIRTALLE